MGSGMSRRLRAFLARNERRILIVGLDNAGKTSARPPPMCRRPVAVSVETLVLLRDLLDAPTALAACCEFDLCHTYIWHAVFGIFGCGRPCRGPRLRDCRRRRAIFAPPPPPLAAVLYRMQVGRAVKTVPTVGFIVETIKLGKLTMNVWVGARRLRV